MCGRLAGTGSSKNHPAPAPIPVLAPPLIESLAARLLRSVFGCYFLVTVAVTGVQLALEYRHAELRLVADIEAMQQTFSPGIGDAMWRFNGDVLRGILSGMRAMPVVVGVRVVDEHDSEVDALGTILDRDGTVATVDERGHIEHGREAAGFLNQMVSRTFDLVHTDESGARQWIGRWTVFSNQRIIVAEVEADFLVVLVNSVIKTLALWFILVLVIQRNVGRPLRQLSSFVTHLDIDNLGDEPFALRASGRNELHLLTQALNLMAGKLKRSIEENGRLVHDLRIANATLQAKVDERTRDLARLAVTDPLTGLFNRRKLDDVLQQETRRVARSGGALSVVIGDIDTFKSVNDRHGHQVGDRVLVGFAELLREGLRATDTLGRWGGEEFLVICPQTDLAGAAALAEQLRRRVADWPFPVVGPKTCSFGVAELGEGESLDAMLARADAALYGAKEAGRNRVEVAVPAACGATDQR